jgi:hypothetical protein
MGVANTLAYGSMATITAVKSLIVQTPSLIYLPSAANLPLVHSPFIRVGFNLAQVVKRASLL